MRIPGPSRTHLDQLGDEFAAMVDAAVRQALTVASKDIKATSTPDDLGAIRRVFETQTTDTLIPHLAKTWQTAADDQRRLLTAAAVSLTAAVIPPTQQELSEQYLATASNRLVGVSDEVWGHARSEMLAGLQNGESIPQIRKRIVNATGLAAPRANVIARTEVIGASNRGSLAQMKAAGYPATKTWLATGGPRTRPTHATANGQVRQLEENFEVGGAAMDGPHDPTGPAAETISCRCTLTYDIPDDDLAEAAGHGWDEVPADEAAKFFFPVVDATASLRPPIDDLVGRTFYRLGNHGVQVDMTDPDPIKVNQLLTAARGLIETTYPATSVKITVADLSQMPNGARALGLTYHGRTDAIFLSEQLLRKDALAIDKTGGHWMPAADTVDDITYVLTHEYGHAIEPTGRDMALINLYRDQENKAVMSQYGRGNSREAFAEAWAEWSVTRGATTNPAALAYAAKFGWRKP